MTERYTAADFANARFAEHPSGGRGHRVADDVWHLSDSSLKFSTGQLALDGWVPVPTKPQITESRVAKELKGETSDFEAGFHYALAVLETKIIPDPEPTNTEKLVDGIAEAIHESGRFSVDFKEVKFIAKYLNDHGITAPNVKDN